MITILLFMYFSSSQPEALIMPDMEQCGVAALIALRSAGPDRVAWAHCVQVPDR